MFKLLRTVMDDVRIDIVLPWVDGDDPEWKKERDLYKEKEGRNFYSDANSDIRYESWDNLKFWFRAIEENLSFFNSVFFITWGHIPKWLDTNNKRLKVIKHSDFMPKEYLPTFNINPIELNLHRIEDLSEDFIYFNDDFFPLQRIEREYYFKDRMVLDEAVESPIMPVDIGQISAWSCAMKANDILFINRHFNKREVQERNYDKWFFKGYGELLKRNENLSYWNNFCGFHDPHMAQPMKKSTIKKLWDLEEKTLDTVSRNRFRSSNDLNQYLIRYFNLCEGNFIPRKTEGRSFLVTIDNYKEIANIIREKRYQMISLNEDCKRDDFLIIKKEINSALSFIFNKRSSFEK